MNRWPPVLSGIVCVLALLCRHADAQTPWAHPDGTTHWYDVVIAASGSTWNDAELAARTLGGYLATITSAAENAVVFQLIDDPAYWVTRASGMQSGPWIGGIQPSGSPEPAGGWAWVSTEPLGYTNWAPNQPDNAVGNENRMHFGENSVTRTSTWSDTQFDDADVIAYVIEWDHAPDQTVGLFTRTSAAYDGYTLVPTRHGTTYLVDLDGRVVHSWSSNVPAALSHYLLDNGDLLRASVIMGNVWNGLTVGGITGRIQRFAWDGTLVWEWELATTQEILHHDIEVLPNGNLLVIAFERKTAAEAIAAGRDPALLSQNELWPEKVMEIQPVGTNGANVVWEWKVWDHLVQDFDPAQANYGVVSQHPELVDINYHLIPVADWLHFNAIDYNAQLDQIVLSSRSFSEIWIIDHSTTTAEAATHSGGNSGRGGDLLYRWGNPEAYGRGVPADKTLFVQHDSQWIEPGLPGAGNLLLFNNGQGRLDGDYSSVDELVLPWDPVNNEYTLPAGGTYGPAAPTWSFTTPFKWDFFSAIVSGCQRLSNGNTLITSGVWGAFVEVTPAKEVAWLYINPGTPGAPAMQGTPIQSCGPAPCNLTFRTDRYAPTHPALAGRVLIPGSPVEAYPPQFDARFGSVDAANGGRERVLTVNGSTGDVWQRVYAEFGSQITIALDAPSSAAGTAHYVMYVYFGEPGPGVVQTQPANIGTSCMLMPILSGTPVWPQITLANTLAAPALGTPALNLPEAPIAITSGLLPGTFTFQGLIVDPGSAGPGVSVTNAVVLTVQ